MPVIKQISGSNPWTVYKVQRGTEIQWLLGSELTTKEKEEWRLKRNDYKRATTQENQQHQEHPTTSSRSRLSSPYWDGIDEENTQSADKESNKRLKTTHNQKERETYFREVGTQTEGKERGICLICQTEEVTVTYIPCGHTFCYGCNKTWARMEKKECPNCKQPAKYTFRIFV